MNNFIIYAIGLILGALTGFFVTRAYYLSILEKREELIDKLIEIGKDPS